MVNLIQDAIKQAQRRHREIIEASYDGSCNVYERQQYKDPETRVTSSNEVLVFGSEPCHVSYSSSPVAALENGAAKASQEIKLFLKPEIEIRPGSRIAVTQAGRAACYSQSGRPVVYSSHQEILLELWRGYAE